MRPRRHEHQQNVDNVIALLAVGEATPDRVREVVLVAGRRVSQAAAYRWINLAIAERSLRAAQKRIERGRIVGGARAARDVLLSRSEEAGRAA
ncbi:MAG TPA: hypothetical protein VHB21_11400 [Minicystis sp.]|nr:hypothetical protein [Minicystis sp.]